MKKTQFEIAHELTGSLKCSCGAEMVMYENRSWDTQRMACYFACEACGKHTRAIEMADDAPVGIVMMEMKKLKDNVERMNANGIYQR